MDDQSEMIAPFTIQLWIHPLGSTGDPSRPPEPLLAASYPTLNAAIEAARNEVDWDFWTPEIMDRDGRVMAVEHRPMSPATRP